ncbi:MULTISPECIES: hypothetical protein [unclassified Streptomyces]|uniref:hypothetical protein n=1 Tax=unclassified Streptomyces TaxID=2593676 RepID=UPI0004BD63A6|nr:MULTISPECIES: hypothetical protein [unclassified Streptomyces]
MTTRIGEPYAVHVSCRPMDAARAFLRDVLPGLDGLVDRHPDRDRRRRPSSDLAGEPARPELARETADNDPYGSHIPRFSPGHGGRSGGPPAA